MCVYDVCVMYVDPPILLSVQLISPPPPIPTKHTHTHQVTSSRREFPIFELQNNVKYEFVPSVTLQYKDFFWQASFVFVALFCLLVMVGALGVMNQPPDFD